MSLEQWSYIAAIVGALMAVIGFPLLGWQLFIARSQRLDAIRLSTSQVLLAVDAVLATHADVAAKLRDGWHGHPTPDELHLVEPYLGVFERIFIAYQAGQVDCETLDQLYGYRLSNIWANRQIVDMKLQHPRLKRYWKRVIALTLVLEKYRGRPFTGHDDDYFPADILDRQKLARITPKSDE